MIPPGRWISCAVRQRTRKVRTTTLYTAMAYLEEALDEPWLVRRYRRRFKATPATRATKNGNAAARPHGAEIERVCVEKSLAR